ncbi:hypothetical protein LV84_00869 [Algoriphagus ratkowskyi]|uniref:Uncharacterized protein n=1 Tax=Algoriphagus ratkowskyi TaxID=57028 RepID=A0A2W7RHH5_9BACT|nr:hypothetical protein LV84_00869 [Algoriphagus ratkowskyi]
MENRGSCQIINIFTLAILATVCGICFIMLPNLQSVEYHLAAAVEYRQFGVKVSAVYPDLMATPN